MMSTPRKCLGSELRGVSLRPATLRMVLLAKRYCPTSLAFKKFVRACAYPIHTHSSSAVNSFSRLTAPAPDLISTYSKPRQCHSVPRASRWSLEQAGSGPSSSPGSGFSDGEGQGEGESKSESQSEAVPQDKQPINVVLVCPQVRFLIAFELRTQHSLLAACCVNQHTMLNDR